MTDFGLVMFPADYAIAPAELARACEHNGFESLFFPEHTHIPASRLSPWPGGAELPKEYWHTHDPFVGLAAVFTGLASYFAPGRLRRSGAGVLCRRFIGYRLGSPCPALDL